MKRETYIDLDGQELIKTILCNGDVEYENNEGFTHRLDGPALTDSDGYQAWYKNGKLHKEDGPAVIDSVGEEKYYLEGIEYTKEEHAKITGKS